jgi:hypothetical protein
MDEVVSAWARRENCIQYWIQYTTGPLICQELFSDKLYIGPGYLDL